MIWSDETHSYQATMCPRIGGPCPEAACLVKRLAQSLATVRPFTKPDFEVAGFSRLDGCPQSCGAQFVANHRRVRLFCGVEMDTELAPLDAMADAIFGNGDDGVGLSTASLPARPLALVEARSIA
ncbi:hypothetical protein N0B44_11885 [Roseibacterium beibuensis]|uniref:Uncharacterized protein n=1 Tax=[Roseibacterium] beibuensis TaxID=1193142 RepID=A0ABP9LEQ3_9RHOB|nr:hypothetical protein [Roseibacterium beibuensis]MCS6623616.1 hypothetical protein [Roseibacterium beibuensis]